eukprot:Pgem_evm1s12615
MPTGGLDFSVLLTTDLAYVHKVITTGCDILKQIDETTKDGMKSVFETNVYGHIKTRIVFTGSSAARESSFEVTDIEHSVG